MSRRTVSYGSFRMELKQDITNGAWVGFVLDYHTPTRFVSSTPEGVTELFIDFVDKEEALEEDN